MLSRERREEARRDHRRSLLTAADSDEVEQGRATGTVAAVVDTVSTPVAAPEDSASPWKRSSPWSTPKPSNPPQRRRRTADVLRIRELEERLARLETAQRLVLAIESDAREPSRELATRISRPSPGR